MTKSSNDRYATAMKEASKRRPDFGKAYSFLQSARKAGDLRASYALATWYLHGRHVKRDLKLAVKLLKQAAEGNVPSALYDLAVC